MRSSKECRKLSNERIFQKNLTFQDHHINLFRSTPDAQTDRKNF